MLEIEELIKIRGGAISTTFLNSLSRFIETIFDLGKSVGSSLRRTINKKVCKLS